MDFIKDFIVHAGLSVGYLLIFLIIFAESGILIGFFLPGDSLMISLGVFAATGYMNVWMIVLLGCLGAILGDSVGFAFGRRVGLALYDRKESWYFKKEYLHRANAFYKEHGNKTIVLARFIPIVRTFAPIVAGIAEMDYRNFVSYNIIGGITWIASTTLLGYYLGRSIPNLEHYILQVVALIIVASVVPVVIHVLKEKRKAASKA